MPGQFTASVVANEPLTGGYFVLRMRSDPGALGPVTAGQFVMLRGDWGRDLPNPRAFSIFQYDDAGGLAVIAKAYGRGTQRLKDAAPGDPITVTGPLGRGFGSPQGVRRQLLVAGGVGLPPLHLHARQRHDAGDADKLELYYGGRDADDLVLVEDFERWGIKVHLATEDGSRGHRGFVTSPLGERLAGGAGDVELLSCGPTPMLQAVRALALQHDVSAQLCLEEEMACGFGVCLGCAVPVYGPKPYAYCCSDGPVFDAREVRWS